MMTLAQAHALLPGSTLVGDGAPAFARVHSDTRTCARRPVRRAARASASTRTTSCRRRSAAGAVAALAERGLAEAGLPGLQVADTQHALADARRRLARALRSCR